MNYRSVKLFVFALIGCVLPGALAAQTDIPLLRPEERRAVDEQRDEFYGILTPVMESASKSTVWVWVGNSRLAYGTVIADGTRILTKWSELSQARGKLAIQASNQPLRAAGVTGVYSDEDLAVLKIEGDPLPPVQWSFDLPELGKFLTAPRPDGILAAFGVVSVNARNLRETDQAFLGVDGQMGFAGPGVKIDKVREGSGAATAGLKPGDVIVRVGDRPISGLWELRNTLAGVTPGTTVEFRAKVNGIEKSFNVLLGNRPNLPQFSGDRLRQMELMGGAISRVRSSFSRAIQTDMPSKPTQIGGPVVDLQGRVVGVTVARADRTRSFLMPSAAVVELLKNDPENPELAKAEPREEPPSVAMQQRPRTRVVPAPGPRPSVDRLRRHLSDVERLRDRIDEEMPGLEETR